MEKIYFYILRTINEDGSWKLNIKSSKGLNPIEIENYQDFFRWYKEVPPGCVKESLGVDSDHTGSELIFLERDKYPEAYNEDTKEAYLLTL